MSEIQKRVDQDATIKGLEYVASHPRVPNVLGRIATGLARFRRGGYNVAARMESFADANNQKSNELRAKIENDQANRHVQAQADAIIFQESLQNDQANHFVRREAENIIASESARVEVEKSQNVQPPQPS